jgi:hypothetical protein
LERFYEMFLADGAPYSLDWFQKTYGDRDIELTGWDVDHTDGTILTRSMTFTHPIKTALGVGPSEARTTRHQRLRRFDNLGIMVENTVIVDNVPSADAFYVQDHWLIEATNDDQVTLSTRFGTRFTKRALFRGMIEKNVVKETSRWCQGYTEMVQAAVAEKLTVEAAAEPKLVAADTSLSMIMEPLQRISVSMGRAIAFGAFTLLFLFASLLYQLLLMREAISLMRDDITKMQEDVGIILRSFNSQNGLSV